MNDVVLPSPREHAVALSYQAQTLLGSDMATAYRCAASAVAVDETYADGWLLLGAILGDLQNYPASVAACKAGLRCPDVSRVVRHKLLINLGHRAMQMGDMDEAENSTDAAIQIFGRDPDGLEVIGAAFAHTNRSLIYSHRRLDGAAIVDGRRGLAIMNEPIIELGLAFAHLFAGDYAEGLKHMEARFPYKLDSYQRLPWPRWNVSRDEGGVLIVMCEQGLGDSLSFARFIPEAALHVDRLIFQVQPELMGLLAGVFPDNVELLAQSYELPVATAWCPVSSLPVALGLTTEQIRDWPGLDPASLVGSDLGLGHGYDPANFNIAIAYAGSPANEIDRHRSIPPHEFLPLLDVPGVRLWSVQVGPKVTDLHTSGMAALVHDTSPWIRDSRDTAAVLRQIDLVVCCESFVGHLAGALGIEAWVLCSKLGRDWRTGHTGSTTLWYPRTRLFRQDDRRAWGPVVRDVVKALREKVDERVVRERGEHGPHGATRGTDGCRSDRPGERQDRDYVCADDADD